MAGFSRHILELLEKVPSLYRGPGGAVAVLRDGELVGEHVWGYANLEKRIPLESSALMPICSITKQMLCMILVDLERNPTSEMAKRGDVRQQLADGLRGIVQEELLEDTGLNIENLCNNQSGIRDYWAMSMFWGTQPEGVFTLSEDVKKALSRTKSLHFPPGTQYAYSNLNFNILARVVEKVTGSTLGDLLAERLFSPARMETAAFCEDNAHLPGPCVGYEGNESFGFIPAVNRVQWSGDAGVVASLKDMIAYEQYLDKSWSDEQSLYRAIAKVPSFQDGATARYGHGLAHVKVGGVSTIGHGGSLRGYCLHRLQVPSERLAIVVMLNHEIDAETIAEYILKNILNMNQLASSPLNEIIVSRSWLGTFFDPDAQLALTVRDAGPNRVSIRYSDHDETVVLVDANKGSSETMSAIFSDDSIQLHRQDDNRVVNARRIPSPTEPIKNDYAGQYRCEEIDSLFTCTGTGGMLYGSFEGFLGHGPMHLMRYLGEDIWFLTCPRGLDAPAPGDWTVVFQRDENDAIVSIVIGCWLARNVRFSRL
ncbi:D-aminopeptidase [Penicillium daleae]|uniref:D-aminopeptidase n=1 Tax=Penicillium daleae TaxID=63821 RepID=A0AAD6CBZ7_9EURO|nr:D-aminopeptidase [Penicillium daleae]KAJ5460332.1 D-aminopeptidase [Penicillium daleae]